MAHYNSLSAGPKARVIGTITQAISRSNNAAGESALGDVIADAQLAAIGLLHGRGRRAA